MDRLATIEAFVKVSETHSFSEAARRLRSSKSVVSRQIAALEGELGARLFHRTTRSLTLTEAGRSYFERASRILADLQDANRSVSQLQAAPRGQLRVNAPMSFGLQHLAPALPDFLARYAEVEVDMTLNDRFGPRSRCVSSPRSTRTCASATSRTRAWLLANLRQCGASSVQVPRM